MKKRNLTLFTAFAAAAAFASTANAAVMVDGSTVAADSATYTTSGDLKINNQGINTIDGGSTWTHNPSSPGNGLLTFGHSNLAGTTLTISGAGVLDVTETDPGDGYTLTLGNQNKGVGYVTVTGTGSKIVTVSKMRVGRRPATPDPGDTVASTLTIENGGMVMVDSLEYAMDTGAKGDVRMGYGGILAIKGTKTLLQMATIGNGVGEFQYHTQTNGTAWVDMSGAIAGTDYTLEAGTDDLTGYTVLTMLGGTTPAADPKITSITVAGGIATIIMKGTDGTDYACMSSTTLDDGFPTPETADPFDPDPITTTEGTATFTVDASEVKNFYVVEEVVEE